MFNSRKNKKYYIVYETTNKINGKKYRGMHATDNLDDGYLGSGKILKQAFKKYKRENFERIVLKFCKDAKEMYETEKELVHLDWVKNEDNYNIITGGLGGMTGFLAVKDKEENTLFVPLDDPRYLSGELVSFTVGKVVVKDKNNKAFTVSVNDPRYLSGELISCNKENPVNKIRYEEEQKSKIDLVKKANIDFSKFGWVKQVSLIIGISSQKCSAWLKRFIPERYETAFKKLPAGTIKHFYCSCGNECSAPMIKNKEPICFKCSSIKQRIVQRPSKEMLEQLLNEYTIAEISRMFHVSRGAIRNWCNIYNIESRKRLRK